MLRLQKFFRIRIPGGPINIFHMLHFKLLTSRKSRKQQRLIVLLHICDFDRKFFVANFGFVKCFG